MLNLEVTQLLNLRAQKWTTAESERRRQTGSSAVEIAVVVPLLFGFVMIPLLDLGCIGLRAYALQLAARDGAAAGARSADATAARSKAEDTAKNSLNKFTGIKINQISSRFVRVSLDNTKEQTRFTDTQTGENPKDSVFQIEVEISGEVEPLIKFSNVFGKIPGLTTPSSCNGIARAYFERPENLCASISDSY